MNALLVHVCLRLTLHGRVGLINTFYNNHFITKKLNVKYSNLQIAFKVYPAFLYPISPFGFAVRRIPPIAVAGRDVAPAERGREGEPQGHREKERTKTRCVAVANVDRPLFLALKPFLSRRVTTARTKEALEFVE